MSTETNESKKKIRINVERNRKRKAQTRQVVARLVGHKLCQNKEESNSRVEII